jgi:hypothetical protein
MLGQLSKKVVEHPYAGGDLKLSAAIDVEFHPDGRLGSLTNYFCFSFSHV